MCRIHVQNIHNSTYLTKKSEFEFVSFLVNFNCICELNCEFVRIHNLPVAKIGGNSVGLNNFGWTFSTKSRCFAMHIDFVRIQAWPEVKILKEKSGLFGVISLGADHDLEGVINKSWGSGTRCQTEIPQGPTIPGNVAGPLTDTLSSDPNATPKDHKGSQATTSNPPGAPRQPQASPGDTGRPQAMHQPQSVRVRWRCGGGWWVATPNFYLQRLEKTNPAFHPRVCCFLSVFCIAYMFLAVHSQIIPQTITITSFQPRLWTGLRKTHSPHSMRLCTQQQILT